LAKSIMIQGTCSSAGKSLLVTALCRILKQDGYRVAPYKSQNMATNSFITKDGKEMGRAQVVQAEAAMVEPIYQMNPILLKPTGHKSSQVVINGEVYGPMTAIEYNQMKPALRQVVKEAYHELRHNFDVIVIEGAGSPAEINLREDDIVNMGLAELVDAPVILVGDIDRGGVFAALYGTLMLLNQEERERIQGFIINKFRGDLSLLEPGIEMIEEKMSKLCLGVIPYLDIKIDEEDTLIGDAQKGQGGITIGIIKLPYISSLSDFTPLALEESVTLRYITHRRDFQNIDMLILPGSANIIRDMEHLVTSGFHEEIHKKHREGIPILGICQGYYILGQEIIHPSGAISGLSLLPIKTQVDESGWQFNPSSQVVSSMEGNLWGVPLHGFFEDDEARYRLLEQVGCQPISTRTGYRDMKENEYNRLADMVRESISIDAIKEIMGL
jgi:adenosylcobyric acid synthase